MLLVAFVERNFSKVNLWKSYCRKYNE